MGVTKFVETEALLAVLEDDPQRLADLLNDMLPGERRDLAEAAQKLADSARAGKPSLDALQVLFED